MHWIWYHLGISGTGPYYAFWSGIGSDLAEITLIGAIWQGVREARKHHREHQEQLRKVHDAIQDQRK